MKRILLLFLNIVNVMVKIISLFLPWVIRRFLLVHYFKYDIASDARIGFAYVFPKHLVMKSGSVIKHFNVAINLDEIILERNALIDRSNWITGFPTGTDSPFFKAEVERKSLLCLGANSVITKKHHFDCTNKIEIGQYVTIAGYNSQFLTHSVNVYTNHQGSKPISIGDYCFVSTRVTILGGASLPSKSVLGAGALLNNDYKSDAELGLYTGVPAKRKKNIIESALYFCRVERDVI